MVTIANAVGSGDLGIELDIPAVEGDLDAFSTEYDPSNYHGLYARFVEDGPLVTAYRSGKYIVTGASSFDELHETNELFLTALTDLGIINSSVSPGFGVQNVVCTAELDEAVNLNALAIGLGLEVTEYEPEQFPGLVYRPEEFSAVLLVFASGSVVITGATDLQSAEAAFEHLRSQIGTVFPD